MKITVGRSTLPTKKLQVTIVYNESGARHTRIIHIGQRGAEDYTVHRDEARKARYIARHAPRERWGRDGILTPGFWARWLLWNKKTLGESVADVKARFGL